MRILLELGGARETVTLRAWRPEATVAQLLAATGYTSSGPVYLDGVAVSLAAPLRELPLYHGSRMTDVPPAESEPQTSWWVAPIGLEESRPATAVPRHRSLTVGRAPDSDVPVQAAAASWRQCTFEREGAGLRLRDHGSTNGTVTRGVHVSQEGIHLAESCVVIAGGVALSVFQDSAKPPVLSAGWKRPATASGRIPFNRPPQQVSLASAAPPLEPPRTEVAAAPTPLSPVALLLPLGAALVLAAIMGDARLIAFAALSPVLALSSALEQRFRAGRRERAARDRFRSALTEFLRLLAESTDMEIRRRGQQIPDHARAVHAAFLPTPQLWWRRRAAPEFLCVQLGIATVRWQPALAATDLEPQVAQALSRNRIPDAPIVGDLNQGGVLGVVGERDHALALARSVILQVSAQCAPSDVRLALVTDVGRADQWEWFAWLPHQQRDLTLDPGSGLETWAACGAEEDAMLRDTLAVEREREPGRATLLVIDSGRRPEHLATIRMLGMDHADSSPRGGAGGVLPVAGIVIATSLAELPASCTTVVTISGSGVGDVLDFSRVRTGADVPTEGTHRARGSEGSNGLEAGVPRASVSSVRLLGMGEDVATDAARRLARFEDPALTVSGGHLPIRQSLSELLAPHPISVADVHRWWGESTGVSTPIGMAESGPQMIDLVADGPHGLVGGTTGSGKSEFLRTLVIGLALRNAPTELNFILIDFKGGAAFGACARLPHTVGTLSNLDPQLAERALRALSAELARRQRLFAAACDQVDSLDSYRATRPDTPLARLLLVIDEFAVLGAELPEVLAGLVEIATVGRALGVHLILATQRPAGAVTEDILTNTNLRLVLRVQSTEDSRSVIGVPDASRISRAQPGRAYLQRGSDERLLVQTALVSEPIAQDTGLPVEVLGEGALLHGSGDQLGKRLGPAVSPAVKVTGAAGAPTELDRLIELTRSASRGIGAPRPVWPAPLPETVALPVEPRPGTELAAFVALADEPEAQRQRAAGWSPTAGNLILIGQTGSGVSATIASIALELARTHAPDELEVWCLDFGGRSLVGLAGLPHTRSYVGAGPGSRERSARFLRHVERLVRSRQTTGVESPAVVVLVDGFAALRDEYADYTGQQLFDGFVRAYTDGLQVGVHFVIATTRARAIAGAIDETTAQRWVFQLPDDSAFGALGVRRTEQPAPVPGRCLELGTRRQLQIARPAVGLETSVARLQSRWPQTSEQSDAIGVLPSQVAPAAVVNLHHQAEAIEALGMSTQIPMGIREDSLLPAVVGRHPGEHITIAGPARSGKSTLLCGIADVLSVGQHPVPNAVPTGPTSSACPTGSTGADAGANGAPEVYGISQSWSPLAQTHLDWFGAPADLPQLLSELSQTHRPTFVLIDDADQISDADGKLADLIRALPPEVCLMVAARAAALRERFQHWTRDVRASRSGVLLQPDIDVDGELLGVRLPRYAPVPLSVGRGYLCANGEADLAQFIGIPPQRSTASDNAETRQRPRDSA